MKYMINYYYICHTGCVRKKNQDNYSCNGIYLDISHQNTDTGIGRSTNKDNIIVGVFDGLGGEEKGEDASFIAAKIISSQNGKRGNIKELQEVFLKANDEICKFAVENGVNTMGTTAACLAFYKNEILLANIGDSKVFRFSEGKITQISRDHTTAGLYGMKPPLSQFLGIPESEMMISPYIARGYYNVGDCYLICSDGLTDMVSNEVIEETLRNVSEEAVCNTLLNLALDNGGQDNITIVYCSIKN